jgi:two-component system cell cycle response regulator
MPPIHMTSSARCALIVEPSRARRSVLAALLRETGAEYAEAANIADGLQQVQQQSFDLVCVAAKLPDGNAAQFCTSLRGMPAAAPVPVLVLLPNPAPDSARDLLGVGATEVMDRHDIERVRQFFATVLPPVPVLSGRVLVVDEDIGETEAILVALRNLGLEAHGVTNPAHALTRVRDQPIDVLIIAPLLQTPVSGAALIREVRALPGSEGRTPVLAISEPTDPARRIEVLRSGADDFIPQPIVIEELTVRVERMLRGKRRLEESEAQRASFEALALTDPLTTLNNRRFLSEVAPMYLAEARRHGFPLSVIVVDIDHFDHITHTYTPPICEEVLRSIGRLLRRECRRGDVAVRCKDDEFVILMSHCTLADAQIKADALRAAISSLKPCGVALTVSVGVAQAQNAPGEGFGEVFACARRAALTARQGGCDRVVAADACMASPDNS